jgi:hypothetical protein
MTISNRIGSLYITSPKTLSATQQLPTITIPVVVVVLSPIIILNSYIDWLTGTDKNKHALMQHQEE